MNLTYILRGNFASLLLGIDIDIDIELDAINKYK
jgi:hypothetical protein